MAKGKPPRAPRTPRAARAPLAPLNPGDTVQVEITGLASEGDGVGRYQGFAVFVPLAVPGDLALVDIHTVEKRFARGELREVLRPGPGRTEAPCQVAGDCGGCQLQNASYDVQLQWKRQLVIDAFERIGGLRGVAVPPVWGMEDPWHYRNKAAVPLAAGAVAGFVMSGFFRRGTHRVVPLPEGAGCMLQHPLINDVVEAVCAVASRRGLEAYDERTGEGLLRHVVARVGFRTGEVLAVLVINGEAIPDEEGFARELQDRVPELVGIVKNVNRERSNVILGKKTVPVWGRPYIVERLGGLEFKVSATSFFQVNPLQAERLYERAVEWAAPQGGGLVIDAYCGTGSMALMAATRARLVFGIEEVEAAVADARENARLNGLGNARFVAGRVEEVLGSVASRNGLPVDAIILDPPRKGCEKGAIDACLKLAPPRIVYVSCNPSTLARDLEQLTRDGAYWVAGVQPVDMFPQTAHVECVVLLERCLGAWC